MTRFAVVMFAAAIAVWGLASIPKGGIGDRASSPAYQRVELARTTDRASGEGDAHVRNFDPARFDPSGSVAESLRVSPTTSASLGQLSVCHEPSWVENIELGSAKLTGVPRRLEQGRRRLEHPRNPRSVGLLAVCKRGAPEDRR